MFSTLDESTAAILRGFADGLYLVCDRIPEDDRLQMQLFVEWLHRLADRMHRAPRDTQQMVLPFSEGL